MNSLPTRRLQRLSHGFSLIELMVAVTIGLIVTLSITGVLVSSESRKRTANSVNDLSQTANYVSFVLDKTLRSAGSGFASRPTDTFGCALNAVKNGSVIMPAGLPVPFDNLFSGTRPSLRVAPVIIGANLSSTPGGGDVLIVMSGSVSGGGIGIDLLPGAGDNSSLTVPTGLSMGAGDLVLLTSTSAPGGNCLVTQVGSLAPSAAPAPQKLVLGGNYFSTQQVNSVSPATFDGNGVLFQIGNTHQPPQFQLIGVGANNQLVSYDLLLTDGSLPVAVPMAEGVTFMAARYGIDNNGDNVVDEWVSPSASAKYNTDVLMGGSAAAQEALQNIVAIRVGLILRTNLPEREKVSGNQLDLFKDIFGGVGQVGVVTFTPPGEDNTHFRFRTVEFTVPLRNAIFN